MIWGISAGSVWPQSPLERAYEACWDAQTAATEARSAAWKATDAVLRRDLNVADKAFEAAVLTCRAGDTTYADSLAAARAERQAAWDAAGATAKAAWAIADAAWTTAVAPARAALEAMIATWDTTAEAAWQQEFRRRTGDPP